MALWMISSCNTSDETPLSDVSQISANVALCLSGSHDDANTRMSGSATQNGGTYRDISTFTLIPFGTNGIIQPDDSPLFPSLVFSPIESVANGNNRHYHNERYDLTIGTGSFLCYGQALPVSAQSGYTVTESQFLNGSTTFTNTDNTPQNIKFSPAAIYTPDGKAEKLAQYLTSIAHAGNWYRTDGDLKSLFNEFTNYSTTTAEPYPPFAGSSTNIKKLVNGLYQKVKSSTLKDDIQGAIKSSTYVKTFNETTGEVEAFNDNIENHPTNLPDGAATIRWNNSSQKFEYPTEASTLLQYAYPAELYYFANSTLRTSNSDMSMYYTASNSWNDIKNAHIDGTTITASTRSVAIDQPLQYGVGCLKTLIKAGSATLPDVKGDPVSLTSGTFPLTAVLIGGQYEQTYCFEPTAASSAKESVIYDKSIANENVCLGDCQSDFSAPLYTLAYQTRDRKIVTLVLEFQNNCDKDFLCESGTIYRGTKFYMVAQITPSTVTTDHQQRVITQDYLTTIQLTISSLASAYNALPSLDNDQLRLFTVVQAGIQQWKDGENEYHHNVHNW